MRTIRTTMISRPLDIRTQEGPRCSAYAASCLLRYLGKDCDPKKLYDRFGRLPEGSALPDSVGKVIGAKLKSRGIIEDLEAMIDKDMPVLVLCFYDESPDWNNLHYLLVTGYDEDNIYLADSLHASGRRQYNRIVSRETFLRMWDTSRCLPVRMIYGNNIYYEMGDLSDAE